MAIADASIIFDTRLDPSGFAEGISNIDQKFLDMRDTLIDVASATEKSFSEKPQKNIDNLTQRLARQLEQLNKTRAAVDKLQRSYDDLVSGETEPKSIKNMQRELVKVNAEIEKELNNNQQILELYMEAEKALGRLEAKKGVQMVGDQYVTSVSQAQAVFQALGEELDASGEKLDGLNYRAQSLSSNIAQVKLDPSTSQEAQDTSEALDQAAQRANRLAQEAATTERNLKEAFDEEPPNQWNEAVTRGTEAAKKMSHNVKDVGKSAKGSVNPLEKMVKSLRRLVVSVLVIQVIRSALRGLRDYIGGLLNTNEEFVASLNAIKVNLKTAFQPIIQSVLPLLNSLMSTLADATAHMAVFVSTLFGQSYEASRESAKAADEQAEAYKNVGKEAKQASKSVQGFDQLNRMQAKDGESSGGIFDTVPMPDLDLKKASVFTKFFEDITKALKPALGNLKKLNKALEPIKKFVAQGLIDLWDLFLKPLGTWVLGEGFPRFVDAIGLQLDKVNWDRLNGAVERLWRAISAFGITIGEGLLWFWENALTPLLGWALDNLIPPALDLISAAIEFLDAIISAAMPALGWFWDDFLVNLRDFVWDITIAFIESFISVLEAFTDWARENPKVIETTTKILLTFLEWLLIYKSKDLILFLAKLGDKLVVFAGQVGSLVIANLPALALLALAAAFVIIGGLWDKLSPASRAVTLLGGLAAAAIAAAIAIAVFHASWTVGIAAAVIIGSIAAIGIAFAALKAQTGEKWNVTTPTINPSGNAGSGNANSFASIMSGSSGNFLPALAQGGLIPPRKPRVVLVGDNQVEEEIVSPRSAIREEVKNAMAEMGMVGDSQMVPLLMQILQAIREGKQIVVNDRELGRTGASAQKSLQQQVGKSLVPG